jgi:hypothetical protein
VELSKYSLILLPETLYRISVQWRIRGNAGYDGGSDKEAHPRDDGDGEGGKCSCETPEDHSYDAGGIFGGEASGKYRGDCYSFLNTVRTQS